VKLKRKSWIKLAIIFVVVIALLWMNHRYLQWTPQTIREWILSFGWWAPVIFLVLSIFRPLILFPASLLSIAGGLAFGLYLGSFLIIIGATGGAVISFWIARKLGYQVVKQEWTGRAAWVQQKMEKQGFYYVLVLRLIPMLSFDLISYLAGISKVRFIAYFCGTLLGIIPGSVTYSFLGASIAEENKTKIIIIIVLFGVLIGISIMLGKRLKKLIGLEMENRGASS